MARAVLDDYVVLTQVLCDTLIQFEPDLSRENDPIVDGVGRMHSGSFRFEAFGQPREPFAVLSIGCHRIEPRTAHDGIGWEAHDHELSAARLWYDSYWRECRIANAAVETRLRRCRPHLGIRHPGDVSIVQRPRCVVTEDENRLAIQVPSCHDAAYLHDDAYLVLPKL